MGDRAGDLRGREVEALFRRYFPLLREKCRRMLDDRQEAEDVAQETFTRLWHRGPTTALPQAVLPWLYATCTHLAVDRLRRRRPAEPLERAAGESAESPEADELASARQLIGQLVSQVGPRELAVAILTRVDGLTQPEAARALGMSERTVRRLVQSLDRQISRVREEGSW